MIDFLEVSKHYGQQDVLRDASFRINAGERVGVVGPNGAGKSTVFALLCRDISPDQGRVLLPRDVRIGHVRQQLSLHRPETSVLRYAERGRPDLDALLAEIESLEQAARQADGSERERLLGRAGDLQSRFEHEGGYELGAKAEAALCGLGFDPDGLGASIGTFSGGWQMRAELARALVAEPGLLLLDEPTNYLDVPAIEWLQKYLAEFAGTLMLISHDRYLLNSLTDVTLEIAHATATRYPGSFDRYVEEREQRLEQRLAAHKNQERRKEQLERFVDRFRAKNTKASQVQSKLKMLDKMEEIVVPRRLRGKGVIRLKEPERSGQEVVRLERAGLTYDGDRWVLRRIDVSLQRGDRTALVGYNGTGKSTLLRMLAGTLEPSEGRRVLGHNVTPGYQSQEFLETLNPARTVYETVKAVSGSATPQQLRTLLGGFGFPGDDVEKRVAVLSGGEKVRLAFARLLADPPNFLLLDEPTTHLDIDARASLEEALCGFKGTLCFVSHDIAFVRKVATSVVAMDPPGIRRYHGGFDDYLEKRQGEAAADTSSDRPAGTAEARKAERRERAEAVQRRGKERRRLQKRVREVEQRIEQLEAEQAELAQRLSDDEDGIDYATVNRRLQEIQGGIDTAIRDWERRAYELEVLDGQGG